MGKKYDRDFDDEDRTFDTRPPDPVEALVQIYRRWRIRHRSKHIPLNYEEAAQWFIDLMEGRRALVEDPVQSTDRHGERHWRDPYIDRLSVHWRTFLKLSEAHKLFVLDGITNRNTPWRGDGIDFYKQVIEEQAKFDEDPETYKTMAGAHLPGAQR